MPEPIRLRTQFEDLFGTSPRVFRAPGRVNLIGEHTDYNAGLVMPVALQFDTAVAIAAHAAPRLRIRSLVFNETVELPLVGPALRTATARGHWSDYVIGVVRELWQRGVAVGGADLLIDSDIPLGAGLSSSASFEVCVALALTETAQPSLDRVALDRLALARLCQDAENRFVGMRCGIMDQFAASFGRAGHAMALDCRDLECRQVPLAGRQVALAGRREARQDASVVVCNTLVRHSLADSEYNRRRAECEIAVAALARALPGIRSLRDVTADALAAHGHELDPLILRRARHVVHENLRVTRAVSALEAGDFAAFGDLMRESHRSLRDDYQVSCAELDLMVSLADAVDGVYGARMTGGGFGGCTVNWVRRDAVEAFVARMTADYAHAVGHAPAIYVCTTADGAAEVKRASTSRAEPPDVGPGLDLQRDVHRRYNPLTGDWVLVSPHRTQRPWQGQTESTPSVPMVEHDPACFLCPGNRRAAGGVDNPAYTSTFVFDNDFAALRPDSPSAASGGPLLRAEGESGLCRVICYSPRHDQTMGRMPVADIRRIVDAWVEQFGLLGQMPGVRAVTLFENRGAMMGASSPHPHGQVWANATVPPELEKETSGQRRHLREHGSCLLCDYAALESRDGTRVVCANDHFIAVVPFWAVWPFETLIVPFAHHPQIGGLDDDARDAFAALLKTLSTAYDALFDVSFPYTMGVHQQPTDGATYPEWHFHAHFYPPLLRSATVRKFMVGYELLAGPQRDISPENAASRLRDAL